MAVLLRLSSPALLSKKASAFSTRPLGREGQNDRANSFSISALFFIAGQQKSQSRGTALRYCV
jgi:hypothetical protein